MADDDYTPAAVAAWGLQEESLDLLGHLNGSGIVRRAKVAWGTYGGTVVRFRVEGVAEVLEAQGGRTMTFGTETITINDYAKHVLEVGDLVDVVVQDGEIVYLWISIEYAERERAEQWASTKDDGLFAMRAKAGEKAERKAHAHMVEQFGHQYPPELLAPPGPFTIWWTGKRTRKVDRRCLACAVGLEVKKRNRDRRYRISHSDSRPFGGENEDGGWHCFVHSDFSLHFVSNRQILTLLASGKYLRSNDQYDSWADLQGVRDEVPPICQAEYPSDRSD